MTTIILGAMLVALVAGVALGLAWPVPDHPGVDTDDDHPLTGPLGPIITRGQYVGGRAR